jgi:hypothetical protein
MKKIYKYFGTFALLFASVSASAQIEMWADDFTVGAGQVVTVKINLKNAPADADAMGLSFDLPANVFVVGHEGETAYEFATSEITTNPATFNSTATITMQYNKDWEGTGAYAMSVMCGSTLFKGDAITSTGDWIISLDVATNATAPVTGSLTINPDYSSVGTTPGTDVSLPDASVKVSDKFIAPCNADGYCTICPTIGLDLSGVDAYIVTGASGDNVTLKKITELAAGDAAIVKGSGDVEIPLKSGAATSESGNKLVGVQKYTDTSGKAEYFLVGAEFVKAAATSHLAAGRAYLAGIGSGAKVLDLSFDDDATAIQSVEAEQNNGVLYNLNGVRVDNAVKGVYIQNGRKVVIK